MTDPKTLALAALVGAGFGCAAGGQTPAARAVTPAAPGITIIDTHGKNVGTGSLLGSQFGSVLSLQLSGLPPGMHGLHVHQGAACDPPAFASAGAHLNPTGKQHGSLNPQGPHAGDLPNLNVHADGTLDTTFTLTGELAKPGVMSAGSPARTLVIHAKQDDLKTDPSGNSGDRIACGVIRP
jgi:Cu-Zn family superoxide dismutase